MSRKPPPLVWPDDVPRFVVRRADDKRFFVYDLLRERRCTRLMIERSEAESALYELEQAVRRRR